VPEKKGATRSFIIFQLPMFQPLLLARYQILSGAKVISEQNKMVVRDVHHGFAWY